MKKIDVKLLVGFGISFIFMVMLFRKIEFSKLYDALVTVNYLFVLIAVAATFASYFMRAVRWRYLIEADKKLPLSSLYPSTVIGYMANNILPARLGEFVRASFLAKLEGLKTPKVVASLVIDRLCDGFTVMLLLILTLFVITFPTGMEDAEKALKGGGGITFLIYVAVMIFLILLKRYTYKTIEITGIILKPFPQSLSEKIIPLLGSFISGISISSKSKDRFMIIFSSVIIWFLCVLSVHFIIHGFNLQLPFSVSMFILVLLVFAVMVPASPGFIGTYHYACYKGLSVFGVSDSKAISIALLLHGVSFFPVIIAGFYHLWRCGISLNSIKKASGQPK